MSFEAVGTDSRCPMDVTCVWAGNAVVRIRVHSAAADSLLELNTMLEPKSGTAGGVRVELRALAPAPRSTEPPDGRYYRARLLIRGA